MSKSLGIIFFILLVSLMIGVCFKGLLFLLRYSLEGIKNLIKIIGVLATIVLILMLFKTILDPYRPCDSVFQSVLTRCNSQSLQQKREGLFREKRPNRRSMKRKDPHEGS